MNPQDQAAPTRSGRLRVGVGAAVVLLIVGLGVAVLVSAFGSTRAITKGPVPLRTADAASHAPGVSIFVHVLGAVNRPGLYQLRDADRAVDAVAAAGGFTPTADQQQLNLARLLSDGEQIYVPVVGESPPAGLPGASSAVGGKVNINTADAATLEGLPRVGPAMALRIIAWREANGRFAVVEDLMSVTGIGDKTFAGLKDLVTI